MIVTGKIDLTSDEIRAELEEINTNICRRNPGICRSGIGFACLATPEETHRRNVLRAMQMAISCIVYDDIVGWKEYSRRFTEPMIPASDPRFECTAEQKAAHPLSDDELKLIYAAEKLRISQGTVVRNLAEDDDGFRYAGVRW